MADIPENPGGVEEGGEKLGFGEGLAPPPAALPPLSPEELELMREASAAIDGTPDIPAFSEAESGEAESGQPQQAPGETGGETDIFNDVQPLSPEEIDELLRNGPGGEDPPGNEEKTAPGEDATPAPGEEDAAQADAPLLDSLDYDDSASEAEEDILDDIPESKLAELHDMFKMLENNDEFQLRINEDDLDSQPPEVLDDKIVRALQEDMEEEAEAHLSDSDVSIVEDVTIYDTMNREGGAGKAGAKDDEPKQPSVFTKFFAFVSRVPPKILYISLGVLASLIIFLAAFFITFVREDLPRDTAAISQPAYSANDSNFIFVEQNTFLGGKYLSSHRILLSSAQTVFYFNEYINVYDYNILLTDDRDKEYFLDLSAMPLKTEDARPVQTSLRMQPLDEGVKSFELSISDPLLGESITLKYRLDKPLTRTATKYLPAELPAETAEERLSVIIEDAVFSTAVSTVSFRLSSADSLTLTDNTTNTGVYPVALQDGARNALPFGPPLLAETADGSGTIFGRVDFEPIRSLTDGVNVVFNGISEQFSLERQIPVAAMLGSGGNEYRAIVPAGRYRIYLERMMRSGGRFVLVLHTEDMSIPNPAVPPEEEEDAPADEQPEAEAAPGSPTPTPDDADIMYNRVETDVEAFIMATGEDGRAIVVPGAVRTAQIGADVVFTSEEHAEALAAIPTENIKLYIKSARMKTPSFSVNINPLRAADVPRADLHSYKQTLEESFTSRLAYKSGEIGKGEITGFDPRLMVRHTLMDRYAPEPGAGSPRYSAQVVSLTAGQNQLDAIVREIWQGSDSELASDFYLTHKITAESDGNAWVIVSDEILPE